MDYSIRSEAGNLIVPGFDPTAVMLTYLAWVVLESSSLQKELEEDVAGLSSDLGGNEPREAALLIA